MPFDDVVVDPYCRGYDDYGECCFRFPIEGQEAFRWQRINICQSSLVIAQLHYPDWPSFEIDTVRGRRMHLYLHRSEDEAERHGMPSIDLRISDCLLPARDGERLIVLGDLLGAPLGELEYFADDDSSP